MGMQIMIEGLALAAFGFMHTVTQEPLLKQLLRYVMSDEARHVAFGVLSLQEYYERLGARRDPRAPGVRVRGRAAHARPADDARGVGADGHRPRARSRGCCSRSAGRAATRSRPRCSRRSCRTARSSACSTPATAGCASGSPRSASSSTRTRSTPRSSTRCSTPCPRIANRRERLSAAAQRRRFRTASAADARLHLRAFEVVRPRAISTTPSDARCSVHHCTSNSTAPPARNCSTGRDERDLRRVGRAVEHRLAREQPADGDAVQTADELAARSPSGCHTSMLCAHPSSCSRV